MPKLVLPENYGKPTRRGRAKKIEFSTPLEHSILNILSINNAKYPDKQTSLDIAKKVVKRGLDLGDVDTGLIRLKNFLAKKAGESVSRYTDDDDLLTK